MSGEQLVPYALTTLQRVKDRIFDPNRTIALTGADLTLDSTDVTGITVPTAKQIQVGQTISGTGIPAGTTIAAIISDTEITLSQAATASNTGQTLIVVDQPTNFDMVLTRMINGATEYFQGECGGEFFVQQTYANETHSLDKSRQREVLLNHCPVISLTSFQWRSGPPSNPTWVDFIRDTYDLVEPETDPISNTVYYPTGIIRIYGSLPSYWDNIVKATYVAGWPVDWPNAGNRTTHLLPADITNTVENMVVRAHSRRTLAGKSSQALEGATIAWRNTLDAEDLDCINRYKRFDRAW